MALPALLTLITALTALSGYLRESSLAAAFGAGLHTDAYFIAAAIPMVAGDLLVGSVLTASIVPVFAPLMRDGAPQAIEVRRAVSGIYYLVAGTSVMIAGVLIAAMPGLVAVLSPGFGKDAHDFTVGLGRDLAWLLPLNSLVLLSSLLLNAARGYLVPASAWLVINLAFVAIVYGAYPVLGVNVLVWGPLLGPFLMVLLLFRELAARGMRPGLAPMFAAPPVRHALRLARPILLSGGIGSGLGILMISHLLLRSFGSTFGEGAVSALGYAFRLYEVPVSLMTATAGTLVFTELSRLSQGSGREQSADRCRQLLAWGVIILVPTVCATAVFADVIVRLLFERGAFSGRATELTVRALQGFSPAILFESILMVGLRVLYALRRPGMAVWIGVATIGTLFGAATIAASTHSVATLAGALSASFGVAAALSVATIGRSVGRAILPGWREGLAVLVVAGGAATAVDLAKQWTPAPSLATDFALLLAYAALYAAGIAVLCPARRVELMTLVRAMAHKLHG